MKKFGVKLKEDLFIHYRKRFLLWLICLGLFALAALFSWMVRKDLYDQQAAGRWSADGDYAQLSYFYPLIEEPVDFDFQNLHHQIEEELKKSSMEAQGESTRLFLDAYSTSGKITLSTDYGEMEVNAVGVTEEFFRFHPVRLLTGSYFDENMLMKDGIILDEDAAFMLYGSNDVVGMPVYVGSAQYYIRGVVEREDSYLAQKAGLDSSLCYVPVDTLLSLGIREGSYTYEVLMPNPVDDFAKNILQTVLGDTEGRMEIIENSSRFAPEARKEVMFTLPLRSMSSKGILYPYWENIARAAEDIVAVFYAIQMITFLLFAVLTLRYLWYRFQNRTWNLRTLWEKIQLMWEKRRNPGVRKVFGEKNRNSGKLGVYAKSRKKSPKITHK